MCLAIGCGSTADGAAAIQWPCNGRAEQLWFVGGPNPGSIVNYNSGQCLAISGGSPTPGAKAIQWPCNGGAELDRWFVRSCTERDAEFVSMDSANHGVAAATCGSCAWPAVEPPVTMTIILMGP